MTLPGRVRFETETKGNSEIAYFAVSHAKLTSNHLQSLRNKNWILRSECRLLSIPASFGGICLFLRITKLKSKHLLTSSSFERIQWVRFLVQHATWYMAFSGYALDLYQLLLAGAKTSTAFQRHVPVRLVSKFCTLPMFKPNGLDSTVFSCLLFSFQLLPLHSQGFIFLSAVSFCVSLPYLSCTRACIVKVYNQITLAWFFAFRLSKHIIWIAREFVVFTSN